MKIAAVVVTFNRKKLLIECLNAIKGQTFKPHTVFIIDNASTDGTKDLVQEKGYCNAVVNEIRFEYIQLPTNQGGAGGFYNGIKTAHISEEHFDAVWVMDDDGLPEADCLKNLSAYLTQYDYLAPMVVSAEDANRLAFNHNADYSIENLKNTYGDVVPGYACPFNGILYSRKLIDTIGYPIPELFLWGDEMNYSMRAIDAGFRPHTVISAVHHHPSDRVILVKSLLGRQIVTAPNKWRGYCHWRNMIFNYHKKWSLYALVRYYIFNAWYYLIIKKSWSWYKVFNEAFFSGFKKVPDEGYRKYM